MTNATSPTAKTPVETVKTVARSIAHGRTKLETLEAPASREAYLAERTAWRTAYAETADEIRQAKVARRERDSDYGRNSANMDRQRLRAVARAMIEMRLQAKDRARAASRAAFEERVAVPMPAAAA
jgi:hypothetical protein